MQIYITLSFLDHVWHEQDELLSNWRHSGPCPPTVRKFSYFYILLNAFLLAHFQNFSRVGPLVKTRRNRHEECSLRSVGWFFVIALPFSIMCVLFRKLQSDTRFGFQPQIKSANGSSPWCLRGAARIYRAVRTSVGLATLSCRKSLGISPALMRLFPGFFF